jgi:dolichol kinase
MFAIAYSSGLLVKYKHVKVNYTRKIDHICLFFVPAFVDYFLVNHKPGASFMIINHGLFVLATFIIFIKPIRSRVSMIATAFSSFDRPEDRPHTLLWFTSQIIVGYAVLVPIIAVFSKYHMLKLLSIQILITVFGDGLAEPVGIRFGKHKYTVYSIFPIKKYVRSLEGSLAVFIVSIIVIFIFKSSFSNTQFLVALAAIPIAMTIAEAVSPHTWDDPLLVIIGSGLTFVIKNFI